MMKRDPQVSLDELRASPYATLTRVQQGQRIEVLHQGVVVCALVSLEALRLLERLEEAPRD